MPDHKMPKKGSRVRLGVGNNRVVVKVDKVGGRVHLRNPRNGKITSASARKVYANQQGKKIAFVERGVK